MSVPVDEWRETGEAPRRIEWAVPSLDIHFAIIEHKARP